MRDWMLLFYDFAPDYFERRTPLREEHLRLIHEAHARGELVQSGPCEDPIDSKYDCGVIVFATNDRALVERFAEADPYVQNGVVTRYRIRRWHVVVGG